MSALSATAIASPNIAFVKYWGNRDKALRLPASGSISMNLSGLTTHTRVTFDPALKQDILTLNGIQASGEPLARMARFLDIMRARAGSPLFAQVESRNNFPSGAGLASSASAYAALTLASAKALGMNLAENELSCLARQGSGSACRSIPPGYVEWYPGTTDKESFAASIASPDQWDLYDCIAILDPGEKRIGSSKGHDLADSSPLQKARLAGAPARLKQCRKAISIQDFPSLADVIETESNLMHAVMMTSNPSLFYWQPVSLYLMKIVILWREEGIPVCYTLDAGPNVHLICPAEAVDEVTYRLKNVPEVMDVLAARPGPGAHLIDQDLI